MDIIHLPEVRGYQYCLTIIDRFSRFPMAIPLKDITAQTVADAFFNNWVCMFGTPLTITTDQGSQFESALFSALLNTVSAKRIRTTPYHPASNGLVERWHRTLKTALMCHPNTPWTDLLPSILLGLRTVYKEDLKASPAEMLFGTTLRIPGEFFDHEDQPGNPEKFIEKHREFIKMIRPTPTAHHIKSRVFILKDIYKCSHVFLRVCEVKPPLSPPYAGPYLVRKRIDDRKFVIVIDGQEKIISVDRLKPAFIAKDDNADNQPLTQEDIIQTHQQGGMDRPLRTYSRKKVTFSSETN